MGRADIEPLCNRVYVFNDDVDVGAGDTVDGELAVDVVDAAGEDVEVDTDVDVEGEVVVVEVDEETAEDEDNDDDDDDDVS